MTNATHGPRTALVLVAGLVVGLIVGFGLGYSSAPRRPTAPAGEASRAHEYIGEAKHVNFTATEPFDVYYPHPYARPPELVILTEEMRRGFDYTLVEQRADGFRIKIGSSASRADNPNGSQWLRYRARGELAGAGQHK